MKKFIILILIKITILFTLIGSIYWLIAYYDYSDLTKINKENQIIITL